MKVCIFVFNNCKNDSRVLKEAKTLVDAGHKVKIIAVLDKTTKKYEKIDGFEIVRVSKQPVDLFKILLAIIFLPVKFLIITIGLVIPGEKEKRIEIAASVPLYLKWDLRKTLFGFSLKLRRKGLYQYLRAYFEKEPIKLFVIGVPQLIIFYLIKYVLRHVLLKPFYFLKRQLKKLVSNLLRALLIVSGFYFYRAFKVVQQDPADIYHANDLNTLPLGYLVKRRFGGKLLYDSHELYTERNTLQKQSAFSKWFLRMLESFLIKRTDHTITVSRAIALELGKRYKVKTPDVIMNVPRLKKFTRPKSLRKIIGIPPKDKIMIYVGVITFNRGLEETIQSIKYLDNISLVIMGYGNPLYLKNLKKLIRQEKVSGKVNFFGPVATDDVVKYASSADLGVLALKSYSLSYYYSLPNKFFEYLASGLPVAVSDFPEMKRIVEKNGVGVTFDPEYPEAIAAAAKKVLGNGRIAGEIKKKAINLAWKKYNWDIEGKKLSRIYKSLS